MAELGFHQINMEDTDLGLASEVFELVGDSVDLVVEVYLLFYYFLIFTMFDAV